MVIQLPFVWASLLFVTGISLGHFFPSRIYVFLLVALLMSVCAARGKFKDYLILAVWLLMGCARVNCYFSTEDCPASDFSSSVMAKAKEANQVLRLRLSKTDMLHFSQLAEMKVLEIEHFGPRIPEICNPRRSGSFRQGTCYQVH